MMSREVFAEWIAWLDKASLRELREALSTRESLIVKHYGGAFELAELLAERMIILDVIERRLNGK